MSLNGFQFLVNQARNFYFWCPDDRWRHVRLCGWWLHNRKNAKKWWNWWSELLKRDWTWNFSKVLKWIFRMPFILFSNILAWHHPYQNLVAFKVEIGRKNGIFWKVFGRNFLLTANRTKRAPNKIIGSLKILLRPLVVV